MEVNKKINVLTRFLISCSGASHDILKECPRFEIVKYSSIGMAILSTSLLALLSSFYAFSILFDNLFVVIMLSVFWALIIFNLDRFMVSTMRPYNNWNKELIKAIPRIVVGILISVIISVPIELQIFKTEVGNIISLDNEKRISVLDETFNPQIEAVVVERKKTEEFFNGLLTLREKYYEEYKCECDGTCGTGIVGRGSECARKKEKYETFLAEIELERVKRDAAVARLNLTESDLRQDLFKKKEVMRSGFSFGLADQIKALNEVNKFATWLIVVIFLMIELAPILTKLLSSTGPYENMIMALEREFESNYLLKLDELNSIRSKNHKLNSIYDNLEMQSKATAYKNALREEQVGNYERIRTELQNKIAK
jgi:hypothetical protein